jgi:alpha-glucosidase
MGEPGHGIDVATQETDPRSMLALTRRLIALRNTCAPIAAGSYERRADAPDGVFAFCRAVDGEALFVALNLDGRDASVAVPGPGRVVIATGIDREDPVDGSIDLRPYEGVVIELARS